MGKTKIHDIDIAVLVFLPIVSALISFLFSINMLASVFLFFGLPSIYLSFRAPEYVKKAALFAVIATIPGAIVIDYVAYNSSQWWTPTIFSFRIFTYVPVEELLWGVLLFYFTIMFYEHFLDKHVTKKIWSPHMKYLISYIIGMVVLFLIAFFSFAGNLDMPYFYFIAGMIILVPPVISELKDHPNLLPKFIQTGAYFFYVAFVYEVIAVRQGWWFYPGKEVIGWITILGSTFPFEELFFWFMIFAMFCLTAYEKFDDDER